MVKSSPKVAEPVEEVIEEEVIELPVLEDVLLANEVESTIQSVTVDINAETAELLLNLNTTNRPLTKSLVKLYANEMLRGKWKLNGEPIIFGNDEEGNYSIISGQHRLHAVVLANKINEANEGLYPEALLTLHTVVITGVHLDTADSVDLGMGRKPGHVLYRDEWVATVIPKEWSNSNARKAKWCNTLAIAARLVWLRTGGATVSSAPKFIVSEMLEFIKEDHKGLTEFVSSTLSSSEEEGAGLKISIPYVAGLCYVASLTEEGIIHKPTKEIVLDAMLHIAQNDVKPGTAEHALTTYWNKLFSIPGSKDRDLDIVGPFIKALNAIIAGEKITAAKVSLTPKEKESYAANPPLLTGWDEACFIYAAELKSQQIAEAEAAKEAKVAEKEEARATKEQEQQAKMEAKAEKKRLKDEEAAKALAEVEAAKSTVPVKSGVMAELAKATNKPTKSAPIQNDVQSKIKRKPVPASK